MTSVFLFLCRFYGLFLSPKFWNLCSFPINFSKQWVGTLNSETQILLFWKNFFQYYFLYNILLFCLFSWNSCWTSYMDPLIASSFVKRKFRRPHLIWKFCCQKTDCELEISSLELVGVSVAWHYRMASKARMKMPFDLHDDWLLQCGHHGDWLKMIILHHFRRMASFDYDY